MVSQFEEIKLSDPNTTLTRKRSKDEHQNSKESVILNISNAKYTIHMEENMDPLLLQIIVNKDFLESALNKRFKKEKNKKVSNVSNYHPLTALEFFLKHNDPKHSSMDDEKCSICLCEFYDDVSSLTLIDICNDLNQEKIESEIIRLEHCDGHYFHLDCILNYMNSMTGSHIKCPNCTRIYGVMTGDQPPGTMNTYIDKNLHCAGYPKCGTITIQYSFPSGKLPNGKNYSGTSRIAYLPDNDEGREVLRLLKLSFERKLTFTVGTSVTTGRKDTVVWNGVHHKTNISGGSAMFGYPDPTYFDRVKLELASRGVF